MKKSKEKIKDVITWIFVVLAMVLAIVTIAYWVYDVPKQIHKQPIKNALNEYIGDSKTEAWEFFNEIDENKAAAVIGYNCSNNAFHELSCNRQYYIFLNKVGDKWIVDKKSKKVMW